MCACDPENSGSSQKELADTVVASDKTTAEAHHNARVEDTVIATDHVGWGRELARNGYFVGWVLLIVGLLLLVPDFLLCNSFIQGVAGNVFAAGFVILLVKKLISISTWLNESKQPWADRIAHLIGTKG